MLRAWRRRRAAEETAGGRAGQVSARRGEAASSRQTAAPQQLAGRGAPRAKGEGSGAEEGRRREGAARGGPLPPLPRPAPRRGEGARLERTRARARRSRNALLRSPRCGCLQRACPPSTSAEDLRTFSRTRSSTHLWALPVGVQQAPRRSAVAPELLSTTLCQRLQSASFAGRPTLHKSPRGPPPPSSVPKMPNPSPYSVGSVSPEDPTSFYSCWLLLLVQEASFFY